MDAHPQSFQLEKSGTRVFVNVPDKKEIQVADLAKGRMLANWPVTTCTDNFPMTPMKPIIGYSWMPHSREPRRVR